MKKIFIYYGGLLIAIIMVLKALPLIFANMISGPSRSSGGNYTNERPSASSDKEIQKLMLEVEKLKLEVEKDRIKL